MSHSTQHETVTPTTDTATRTPQPETTGTKPYSEIASVLPAPTQTAPETARAAGPAIQEEYTVPGDHTANDTLPWNDAGIPWRSWRSKFSTIAALYVLAARHAAAEGDERRAVHVVFSPPQADVYNDRAIRHWRARATEIAQEAGIRAGMAAFHGYRVHQDAVEEFKSHIYETAYADTATDVLLWEWLRRDNWREYVQWGPHIHIVGLCDYMNSYNGDGVLHRLRTFEPYDRSINTQAVAEHRAVAKDIMDHVTFNPENPYPPMAWFGELEGDRWWSAKQCVDDETLDDIRDVLINGPANPDAEYL